MLLPVLPMLLPPMLLPMLAMLPPHSLSACLEQQLSTSLLSVAGALGLSSHTQLEPWDTNQARTAEGILSPVSRCQKAHYYWRLQLQFETGSRATVQ
jgi:hypothetical protein